MTHNLCYSLVFCEHFFEHLTPDEALAFLSECRRILRSDGLLRISVPDARLYLENYVHDPNWVMTCHQGREFTTPLQAVNVVFRQWYEHQYAYDDATLVNVLEIAGFRDVTVRKFGESALTELAIDWERRRFESLYVEATK